MQFSKLIVLSNATAGREDTYGGWDTEAHLDDALQVPGIVSAQGLRCTEIQGNSGPVRWGYMAIYECEAKDIGQIVEGLRARSGTGGIPDGAHYVSYFEPVTDLKRKSEAHLGSGAEGARSSGKKKAPLTLASAAPPSDPNRTLGRRSDFGSMRIEDWAGPVAGPTYLEENLQIPRSTLHRWQRRNQVIALRKGLGRHVFPLAQFVDGRPVSGLPDVLALAMHPRFAWSWLINPSPHLDGRVPIALLREDLVEDVVRAARLSCS